VTGDVRLTKVPTTVALFRMSAVMWNAHRVHYDEAYATGVEGHGGLLVPANLLSSYLCEAAMAWGGPASRILRLTFRTRTPVLAGTVLSVRARQVSVGYPDGHRVAELDLGIDDPAGRTPVTGTAWVGLPAEPEGP
jgi:hydroxyacyl-ACP dehydratase HTD2-like protein with hotdog domain